MSVLSIIIIIIIIIITTAHYLHSGSID